MGLPMKEGDAVTKVRMRTVLAPVRDESGFTLLELLVAVLVVAVLLALAIPTFEAFQDRARDRSVQTHVRNGLVLERAYWQETGSYTSLTTDLDDYDPTAVFWALPDATNFPMLILDATSSGQRVCVAALSESGTWFAVYDDITAGKTYYGDSFPAPCSTDLTATYAEGGW